MSGFRDPGRSGPGAGASRAPRTRQARPDAGMRRGKPSPPGNGPRGDNGRQIPWQSGPRWMAVSRAPAAPESGCPARGRGNAFESAGVRGAGPGVGGQPRLPAHPEPGLAERRGGHSGPCNALARRKRAHRIAGGGAGGRGACTAHLLGAGLGHRELARDGLSERHGDGS